MNGKCHICGEYKELTFEHIPPRKAFNDSRGFVYSGEEILHSSNFPWDTKNIKREQLQKGIGKYTLCGKCNNDTGSWYGNEFVDFINKSYQIINQNKIITNSWLSVTIPEIYPLKIAKQIVSMFLSNNSEYFSDRHPLLRSLILSKGKKGISPDDYGLFLFILKSNYGRSAGVTPILKTDTGSSRVVSEFTWFPFGYVLELNPKYIKKEYCDITFFLNKFNLDDKRSINLTLPIRECHSILPTDYRTKEEIFEDTLKNLMNSHS